MTVRNVHMTEVGEDSGMWVVTVSKDVDAAFVRAREDGQYGRLNIKDVQKLEANIKRVDFFHIAPRNALLPSAIFRNAEPVSNGRNVTLSEICTQLR